MEARRNLWEGYYVGEEEPAPLLCSLRWILKVLAPAVSLQWCEVAGKGQNALCGVQFAPTSIFFQTWRWESGLDHSGWGGTWGLELCLGF